MRREIWTLNLRRSLVVAVLAVIAYGVGRSVVQRHRHQIAVRVMTELVTAVRKGEAAAVARVDDDGLASLASGAWVESPFTVLCDNAPGFWWTNFECLAQFESGGSLRSDVSTETERSVGHVLVTAPGR